MAMQVGTQLYLSNPTVYASVEQRFIQPLSVATTQWVAMALSGLAERNRPGQVKLSASHSPAL